MALLKVLDGTDVKKANKLIDDGCDLNMQNEEGETALMLAINLHFIKFKSGRGFNNGAWKESINDLINKLIDKKCDLHLKDKKGDIALMYSIRAHLETISIKIIDNMDNHYLNSVNSYNMRPLTIAVLCNNIIIVKKLINAKSDINVITEQSLLDACCVKRDMNVIPDTECMDILIDEFINRKDVCFLENVKGDISKIINHIHKNKKVDKIWKLYDEQFIEILNEDNILALCFKNNLGDKNVIDLLIKYII